MFSSFFSTSPPVDPNAPTFHPVSSQFKDSEIFGQLDSKDTEWSCPGGFATETQTFYTIGEDGTLLVCQVIHSAVGLWYPNIQFTCKVYRPQTKETTWKSINVTIFKADEFSVTYKSTPGSDYPESYTIRANLAADLQVSLEVTRPKFIPGYKIGGGEKGGFSYFGPDPLNPEGYVVHRIWPRFYATGHIIQNGQATPIQGSGMFVHAIQGMRPNLVASSWNFALFQSPQLGGVSAIQMEFKTLDTYGRKGSSEGGVYVNIGSLVIGDKLATVTAETRWRDEEPSPDALVKSRASHLKTQLDPDTGYESPGEMLFEWAGPSLIGESPGKYEAKILGELGNNEQPNGLIEKVDVLAEIPRVIKMAVNYVAGTKPFVYQWLNPSTLKVTGPEAESTDVEGTLYCEAVFIS